jgi:uncharacterized membrane protein
MLPDVTPLPLRRLWATAGAVSALGVALAIELTLVHVRVHINPAARSFCTFSEHVSCDKTALSGYSVFAGVPLSLWGALAYSLLLLLSLWGLRARGSLPVAPFGLIAAACAVSSLVLAYISSIMLRNLCILCVATWVVDWTLFVLAWTMAKRAGFSDLRRQIRQAWRAKRPLLLAVVIGVACVAAGLRFIVPDAWGKGRVSRVIPGTKLIDNAARLSPGTRLPSGIDDEGHPYIGSAKPSLTITEFADYQCPHCAIAHVEMRELVAKNPAAIRIVHRQFPLDNKCNTLVQRPFHTQACEYAKLAVCASLLGRFWDANDYLFDHGRDETPVTAETLAKALGIDPSTLQQCVEKTGVDSVKRDVEEGLQLNIQGTPSFVVNGTVYKGQLPEEILAPYD